MIQVLCPDLIGRSEELRALDASLEQTRRGSGGIAMIAGEAGIGKSRMLREAADRATALGIRVAAGRAVRAGSRVAFRPLVEAIQSATRAEGPPSDPALRPYRAALSPMVPEWIPEPTEHRSPLLVLEGVLRLLGVLAGDRGLLLLIDDLQWADPDTLAVIEYLADNLASEPVLGLCAARTDEPGPAIEMIETLSRRRAIQFIRLERLSESEEEAMVRSALPELEADPGLLETLWARAEGVPFLVEELLSAYFSSGSLDLPASYRGLVAARLASLDEDARRVIEAASAIGRNFDWPVLTAITGFDKSTVLASLRAAIDAQLVFPGEAGDAAPFGFRHALVGEAILGLLLEPERAELFGRAADAIEGAFPGLPGEWCQLAADLRERSGELEDAGRLMLEIGRRALATNALATAEAALERARLLSEGDRWRTMGVQRLLVDVLSRSGKTTRLREIGETVLGFFEETWVGSTYVGSKGEYFHPSQLGALHLQIARGLMGTDDLETVTAHLARGRSLAERSADPPLLARIGALTAHALIAAGRLDEADLAAAEAQGNGEKLGLPGVVSEAERARAEVELRRGDLEAATRLLKSAVLVADRADLIIERIAAHLDLAVVERYSGGDLAHAEQAQRLAGRAGAVGALASADLELARAHLERFELEAAAQAIDRCLVARDRYRLGPLHLAELARAQLAALRGNRREVEEALARATAAGPAPELAAAAYGECWAVLHLVREERGAAREALEEATAALGEEDTVEAWPFVGLKALIGVIEGTSVEQAMGRPQDFRTAAHHRAVAGYLAAARAVEAGRASDDARARKYLSEADSLLHPYPWRRHHALRLAAEAAVETGWGDPAKWLAEVLSFFEEAGQERIAAACRGLLRRSGARVARRGRGDSRVPPALARLGVTSREVDVLRLVAEGASNADIGERLFISGRTVETHVSRLLRKTGVESRAQLIALAHTLAEKDP